MAGNWKMNKTEAEAELYIQALLPRVSTLDRVEIGICVPFTDLRAMVESARGSQVEVWAQNMHEARQRALHGRDLGTDAVRARSQGRRLGPLRAQDLFGETDKALALKVPAALKAGLTPMLCVGESEEERDKGFTERKLRQQIKDDLAGVRGEQLTELVIAYEPIWAIGTGRVASSEQIQEAVGFIRALVRDRASATGAGADVAERVRILYGGSVTPENVREIFALPDVDGALVGGASLKADSFAEIVAAAAS